MPRKPIDGNPTGIRIDLGGKEREILESMTTTYRLQQILPLVIKLLSNPKKLALIYLIGGIIYERLTGKDMPFIISSLDDFEEMIMEWYRSLPVDYFTNKAKESIENITEGGSSSQNIFGEGIGLADSEIIQEIFKILGVEI
jgi:hypothetical protein